MSADIRDINETVKATDTKTVSRAIKAFINNEDNDRGITSNVPIRGHKYFNRTDVVKALNKIQLSYKPEYIAGSSVNINTKDFKSSLLNTLSSMGSLKTQSINQIDGRTIDFVEMIFGAFLRDRNISPAVKSLLMQLQIPIIKVALLDMKFFYDPKHLSRKLLDAIAHVGIGIEDRNNTVYQTMEMVVQQLLRSFSENISVFSTAISSINRLDTIEKQKQAQNEKLTQTQIRQEFARQSVITELQFQMMGKTIPKLLQPLILKHWSTLMYQRCIKHGKKSKEWNISVNTLRRLINSLQPINSEFAWALLNTNQGQIVTTLEKELCSIKQNRELIFNSIQLLSRTYKKMLDESEYKTRKNFNSDEMEKHLDGQDKPNPNEAREQQARNKLARLPEYVKPGVWFELRTDGPNKRRLKLSVIIREEARLVFVDRLGQKGLEKDAGEFFAELESGQSSMIADHSIFTAALGEVITSLAQNK